MSPVCHVASQGPAQVGRLAEQPVARPEPVHPGACVMALLSQGHLLSKDLAAGRPRKFRSVAQRRLLGRVSASL